MANEIMQKKAEYAQIIFNDLVKRLDIDKTYPTTFIADPEKENLFKKSYLKENPFPSVIAIVLASLRKKAVTRLFENEDVLQTPVIAAVLSLCSSIATDIGALRGDDVSNTKIYSDIAFAGLQAIRLYAADHKEKAFKKSRCASAIRVDNALNGSFYKYKTKDGRYVSFHVYYQSQQEKLVKALGLKKESKDFKLLSASRDIKYLTGVFKDYNAMDLENLAFDCGACACMLRDREEWESSDVGKAVREMPLIKFEEKGAKEIPSWGKSDKKGPLSDIKVLDLTHIIAGPACSRILAEYGADVLLVRRGKFIDQEQAMLELDGWAGKNSIQLDLNIKEDLVRIKELIKEADVITYSYQNGCFDKFGLSPDEIRKINPNIIYSSMNCFSDTVWKERPGWAPLAEDITGLSVRNGSKENPVNLNGVPLDYIPGFFLALGTLKAIRQKLIDGTTYAVATSLTRGAQYLHECTDLCLASKDTAFENTVIETKDETNQFTALRTYVDNNAIGKVGFPAPATFNTTYPNLVQNMSFLDGRKGFNS